MRRIALREREVSYHRPSEVLAALLKLLQGLFLVSGALNHIANATLSHVAQDGLHLILCRRVLGDVELEIIAGGVCLCAVVASLIDGGLCLSIGRDLLQKIGHPCGSWVARLVKDRDDVEGFTLPSRQRPCYQQDWVLLLAIHLRNGTYWAKLGFARVMTEMDGSELPESSRRGRTTDAATWGPG